MPSDASTAIAMLQLGEHAETRKRNVAADYCLPTSCSDAELRIAVRLLAQIATLRGSLTETQRSADALQELAATDALTGLANRRTWDEALLRQSRAAAAQGDSLVVAIVDLDRFKQVNETHGHAVGDAVLRAAAEGLRRAVRRDDLAARLGGDEFGLLLPGLSTQTAVAVVGRIRSAVVASIEAAGLPVATCSVGYAAGQGNTLAGDRLYAAAAAALQRAKQAGRNCSAADAAD